MGDQYQAPFALDLNSDCLDADDLACDIANDDGVAWSRMRRIARPAATSPATSRLPSPIISAAPSPMEKSNAATAMLMMVVSTPS